MITIVSGIPRSGTSLMMQVIRESGIPLLHNNELKSDVNNPNGYQEWSLINSMENCEVRRLFAIRAPGKAVKVLTHNVHLLPVWDGEYRCVFMLRDINSIIASQLAFVSKKNNVAMFDPKIAFRALKLARKKAIAILRERCAEKIHFVHYEKFIQCPGAEAYRLGKFLEMRYDLNTLRAMAEIVRPSLQHQKEAA